jgi:hypothetical protein
MASMPCKQKRVRVEILVNQLASQLVTHTDNEMALFGLAGVPSFGLLVVSRYSGRRSALLAQTASQFARITLNL